MLLLSASRTYAVRRRVLIAQITSRLRFNDTTVELGSADGMPRSCVVNLENLVTIQQDDLEGYLTTLSPARMRLVCRALQSATGCG